MLNVNRYYTVLKYWQEHLLESSNFVISSLFCEEGLGFLSPTVGQSRV